MQWIHFVVLITYISLFCMKVLYYQKSLRIVIKSNKNKNKNIILTKNKEKSNNILNSIVATD